MDYLKKRPYGKGHKKRGELHCATNIKASPNALQKVNTLPCLNYRNVTRRHEPTKQSENVVLFYPFC